jgi:prevent-host-death family protein
MTTKAVGIRELKTHLSRYLKSVKAGSEIVVSERGRAIARITPIPLPGEEKGIHSLLFRLVKTGKVILPASYKSPASPKFRKKVSGTPFSDAVIEGRR